MVMRGPVLRSSQIQVFAKTREEECARKIRLDLEANHTSKIAGIPDERLDRMIRNGIGRARSHKLTKQYTVAMFVELMFIVAPDFDEYPPVATIFRRRDLDPDDKIDIIIESTSEEQWEDAKLRGNPAAWQE